MVEEMRARVENSFRELSNEIDRSHMRKMQAAMHRCAAKCCENDAATIEGVQTCVDDCAAPLTIAGKFVTSEFDSIQNRLQRCIMDCNDQIRDKMGPNPTQEEVQRYTADFEKCAMKCVDNIEKVIPVTRKKIKSALEDSLKRMNL